jgi:hypothetical protein
MKTLSVLTLILALFVASVVFTAVSVLCAWDAPSDDLRLEDLAVGRLHPMLLGPTLWSRYPNAPPLSALIDYLALSIAVPPIVAAVYLLGARRRLPLGWVAVAVLPLGLIPYGLGTLILRAGNFPPDTSGPWLAVMLLGVLYASCASALLAGLEILGLGETVRCRLGRRTCSRRLEALIVAPRDLPAGRSAGQSVPDRQRG